MFTEWWGEIKDYCKVTRPQIKQLFFEVWKQITALNQQKQKQSSFCIPSAQKYAVWEGGDTLIRHLIIFYHQKHITTRSLFFFFFQYGCTCGIWKFLGQGLNLSCWAAAVIYAIAVTTSDPLTRCTRWRSNPCLHSNLRPCSRIFAHCAKVGISRKSSVMLSKKGVYICMCVYTYTHTHTYKYIYTHICIYTFLIWPYIFSSSQAAFKKIFLQKFLSLHFIDTNL